MYCVRSDDGNFVSCELSHEKCQEMLDALGNDGYSICSAEEGLELKRRPQLDPNTEFNRIRGTRP